MLVVRDGTFAEECRSQYKKSSSTYMLRTRAGTPESAERLVPVGGGVSLSVGIPSPSRIHGYHYSRFAVQLACALRPLCPSVRFPAPMAHLKL
jgi:hypothetical protein